MSQAVLLPYDPRTTTRKDIDMLRHYLTLYKSPIRLVAFPANEPPICLADITNPKTITVTLDQTPPSPIFEIIPGRKFFAKSTSKTKLFQDLESANIPTPKTKVFSTAIKVTEEFFGPYITVKTMLSGTSRAKGIITLKTKDYDTLRERIYEKYQDQIQNGFPPLVQQYITTGPKPRHVRVTTFLGVPIVCHETIAPEPFDPKRISGLVGGQATSNAKNSKVRRLNNEPEFTEFAKCVAQAYPKTSVLSIDMVRCQSSKRIFCIEVNLGNLCVLSSPICSGLRKALGAKKVHNQFRSYDTIVKRIIEIMEKYSNQQNLRVK